MSVLCFNLNGALFKCHDFWVSVSRFNNDVCYELWGKNLFAGTTLLLKCFFLSFEPDALDKSLDCCDMFNAYLKYKSAGFDDSDVLAKCKSEYPDSFHWFEDLFSVSFPEGGGA